MAILSIVAASIRNYKPLVERNTSQVGTAPRLGSVKCRRLSVLTTSTLERLSELRPQTNFDQRRFRMNLIVGGSAPGFIENDWVGRELAVGEGVRLQVAAPDGRCVMTTVAQAGLAKDTDVLRTLVQFNRVGHDPCAGVYAVIGAAGTIRIGDSVAIS